MLIDTPPSAAESPRCPMRSSPPLRWICTYAYGSSSRGKLLRYRLDKLVHVGGILSIPVGGNTASGEIGDRRDPQA